MPVPAILAMLLLGGCMMAPVGADDGTQPGRPGAVPSPSAQPVVSLPYTVLAERAGTEQPEATAVRFREAAAIQAAWVALPSYTGQAPIPADALAKVDFNRDSVYLLGIPFAYMSDNPEIATIDETADSIVVRYWTVSEGEISLPATKTQFLAVAFKTTAKPVRFEALGPKTGN